MSRSLLLRSVAAMGVTLGLSGSAAAGEAQAEAGIGVARSTWRGDWASSGQLRFGYRFARIIAVDFVGWEQLATVNKRANTGLTLGGTGYLPLGPASPFLRLYVIHQHEEGLVSVQDHPFGTLFGIGAGIRHRAGAGAALGVEIPFAREPWGDFHLSPAASATWFPDATLGPSLYVAVSMSIGVNYTVPGLP